MADIRYTGAAPLVAQVDTFTPADVEIGDVFTLTATGLDGSTKSISFTAAAATAADVAAGLVAAWNASTHALHTGITASGTVTVILTADTAGDAFTVAATTTNVGGGTDNQTLTRVATTASSGPKSWDVAANWSGGAVPGGAASQDVWIENSAAELIYGLAQSGAAEALASLNIGQSFTGKIGTPGATGASGTYLAIKTAKLNVGQHTGSGSATGSGRLRINLHTTACAVNIVNTGDPETTTRPALELLAANASTAVTINKGKVGIALGAGETSTIGTITVGYVSSLNLDAAVYIGAGVTLTTLVQTGGAVQLACAATTVTATAGTLVTSGAGAYTTVNNSGATLTLESSGAITTVNASGGTSYLSGAGTITTANITGGTCDFTRSKTARTVTTLKLDPGAVLKYDPADLTLTNKIQPVQTSGKIQYTCAAA